MDQLPDAVLALRRVDLAVEVFADHHVGGQLAPGRRDFAIGLLEEHFAVLALDGGGPHFPFDGVKRIGDVGGAEDGLESQPDAAGPLGRCAGRGRRARRGTTHFNGGHGEILLRKGTRASIPLVYLCILTLSKVGSLPDRYQIHFQGRT